MATEKSLRERIKIEGLRFSYGNHEVLKGITLFAGRGETVAVIGPSGCGKTTFLKCISLLLQPNEGNAFLDGQQYLTSAQSVFDPWEIRRNIVMVFQDYNLFPNMTAMRNMTLALEKTRGMGTGEAEKVAIDMARKLGIDRMLDRYPNALSGGQAQRLALARAMVLKPKLLLLDEITAALDPETIVNVVQAIRELRQADETGDLTIILVTHLMRFAEDFADRVAFLYQGVIHEELPAREFFKNCLKPDTRRFISGFQIPI